MQKEKKVENTNESTRMTNRKRLISIISGVLIFIALILSGYALIKTNSLKKKLGQMTGQQVISKTSEGAVAIERDELEKIISLEVSSQISEITSGWLSWLSILLGLILALLGFLGIKEISSFIQKNVGENIEKQTVKFEETYDEKYGKVVEEIDYFSEALGLTMFLDELKRSGTGKDEANFDRVMTQFDKIKGTKAKDLKFRMLDKIMIYAYDIGKYEEMNKIRKKYETEYEFTPLTWANLAIANMNLFHKYSDHHYYEFSLEAAENALLGLPGYGDAQAVKLIIHLLAFIRQEDEKEKQTLKKLLNEINSGASLVSSYEAYGYFLRNVTTQVQKGTWVEKIFRQMEEHFPNEMKTMRTRFIEHSKTKGEIPEDYVDVQTPEQPEVIKPTNEPVHQKNESKKTGEQAEDVKPPENEKTED